MEKVINVGLDAGSTTVKLVATGRHHDILFKEYCRHFTDITGSVTRLFQKLFALTGNRLIRLTVTGSAGMGLAERFHFPFIQEVVASSKVARAKFADIRTLVDIGGEDAKMIFFRNGKAPDMRMNGSCAGGTGAFIDHMASLLGTDAGRLSQLAHKARKVYPVASRCGVFAKTDVQNLLSRNVTREDIAASVFHAVSIQCITSLARGYHLKPAVMLCGGPFARIPALCDAFTEVAGLQKGDVLVPDDAEVITAWGAAMTAASRSEYYSVEDCLGKIATKRASANGQSTNPQKLKPLFSSKKELESWHDSKAKYTLPEADFRDARTDKCYLGIDSGSTTTKIVLLDQEENILFHFYGKNRGHSLNAVSKGLQQLHRKASRTGKTITIAGSCVTGYGEDLIRNAFNLNYGMVETMAHFKAASHVDPDVTFILDIGGQDMKAAFIENHTISRLEINEACSSGCGSFIETFADSLNHSAGSFADRGCRSLYPCNLGTRCTVFMNSKVKQSLREGASVADISAGLGYSVVKNCLHKVLKLRDVSELGGRIMVQGGTSRNKAVIRAMEFETGKEVMKTNYPELMGAYGAALFARQQAGKEAPERKDLTALVRPPSYTEKPGTCKGCENRCSITVFLFENGKRYIAGNKCEKIFSNSGEKNRKGSNMCVEKYDLLFDRSVAAKPGRPTIGIPRVLGMYENYPFWHALFSECGIRIALSDASTLSLYEKGIGSIMSDNICYPAKLVNGHIQNLVARGVDRIFLPFVVFEKREDASTTNSYNCPIVTGYSEVVKCSMNTAAQFGIPLDAPSFSFKDEKLLKKACAKYLRLLCPGLRPGEWNRAFKKALAARRNFETSLMERCRTVLEQAAEKNELVILLAGRPYHTDPLVQHKIADLIAGFGVHVITEDVVRESDTDTGEVQGIMQWAYTNRIFKAALWAAKAPANVHYVQVTSFGCGPDAFILDEISEILRRYGKNAAFLKVDDIHNTGSTRLRIRSLVESLRQKYRHKKDDENRAETGLLVLTPPFEKTDKHRKILVPWFSDFYSPFFPAALGLMGYEIDNLPPSDQLSEEYGLKYSNNEICYPATLVVGDLVKALHSGKYDRDKIAFGITQTGGQCRATNYVVLLKRALISAGMADIPVVSVALGSSPINHQPGFRLPWYRIYKPVIAAMAYVDCLSQMYYATAPRERVKGGAFKLKEKYMALGIRALETSDADRISELAGAAAEEFAGMNSGKSIPRIGIVGEIFLKYNSYGQRNIINWLMEQEIEPVLPALGDFFYSAFANRRARLEGYITRRHIFDSLKNTAENYLYSIIRKIEARAASFPGFHPLENPRENAGRAANIINLNAQFGEGWYIAAEIARFAEMGVNHVLSLQPFGCIANHIVSKGIEKRVRDLYPSMNILYLDFDSGTSEANVYNRLHFMIDNAREEVYARSIPTKARPIRVFF